MLRSIMVLLASSVVLVNAGKDAAVSLNSDHDWKTYAWDPRWQDKLLTFIMFYGSRGCPDCKGGKEKWDELATVFNRPGSTIQIAEVNCAGSNGAKGLCEKQGIETLPTYKFYNDLTPRLGEIYKGSHKHQELMKFVQKKSKVCDPFTLQNCDEKDKGYILKVKDLNITELANLKDPIEQKISNLALDEENAQDMATVLNNYAGQYRKMSSSNTKAQKKLDADWRWKINILEQKGAKLLDLPGQFDEPDWDGLYKLNESDDSAEES